MHEHFSGATLAQFFYVAAQAGIFSFFINYITSEPPGLPARWLNDNTRHWVELRTAFAGSDFKDVPSLVAKLRDKADPVSAHLALAYVDAFVRLMKGEIGIGGRLPVRVPPRFDVGAGIVLAAVSPPS